jgi:hypothetical protein
MAKHAAARQPPANPVALKGWQAISDFLGEPVSVVQRWAKEGMPVRRESRSVVSSPEELNTWMGKQSGKPVHVATETADLSAELKRGLSFVRRQKAEEESAPKGRREVK